MRTSKWIESKPRHIYTRQVDFYLFQIYPCIRLFKGIVKSEEGRKIIEGILDYIQRF
jgi:hypothetical protein